MQFALIAQLYNVAIVIYRQNGGNQLLPTNQILPPTASDNDKLSALHLIQIGNHYDTLVPDSTSGEGEYVVGHVLTSQSNLDSDAESVPLKKCCDWWQYCQGLGKPDKCSKCNAPVHRLCQYEAERNHRWGQFVYTQLLCPVCHPASVDAYFLASLRRTSSVSGHDQRVSRNRSSFNDGQRRANHMSATSECTLGE